MSQWLIAELTDVQPVVFARLVPAIRSIITKRPALGLPYYVGADLQVFPITLDGYALVEHLPDIDYLLLEHTVWVSQLMRLGSQLYLIPASDVEQYRWVKPRADITDFSPHMRVRVLVGEYAHCVGKVESIDLAIRRILVRLPFASVSRCVWLDPDILEIVS